MILEDYLKEFKITNNQFAKLTKLDKSAVTLLLQGKRFPRPETIKKIEIGTNGQVTANDFMRQHESAILKNLILEEKK